MIFEQLIINTVSEIETRNPGDLSSVAALYVETRFSMKDSGGINVPSLRSLLKEEAITIFSSYYANLSKPISFFEENVVDGVDVLTDEGEITLEKVEFINLGEEECEDVVFKKVFFIPQSLLTFPEDGPTFDIEEEIPGSIQLKICNYEDFKTKVKFIQTFMKINFIALQRPSSRSIVKGINFRKFSRKKKQLNKFLNFLDGVVTNKPNKFGESIIIYFSNNFQTIAKIEYINENKGSSERNLIFRQTLRELNQIKYPAFSDPRANYYVYNFESIYPDLYATTFRGSNVKFSNLVRRNFIAPGVDIVQNDCLASANNRQNVSASDVSRRLKQSLSDLYAKEARSLLSNNPFKTAEDLINESGFLESDDVKNTMKKKLKEEFLVEGANIKDEVLEFFDQLPFPVALEESETGEGSENSNQKNNQTKSQQDQLSEFGRFVNSIEWQQILAIAMASAASRYGIDEILDDSFVKKMLAERISKFFKDPRTINALMSNLPTAALQRAALFFAAADLANSVGGGGSSPEQRRLERLNNLLAERDELFNQLITAKAESDGKKQQAINSQINNLNERITRATERLERPTSLTQLLDERATLEEQGEDPLLVIEEIEAALAGTISQFAETADLQRAFDTSSAEGQSEEDNSHGDDHSSEDDEEEASDLVIASFNNTGDGAERTRRRFYVDLDADQQREKLVNIATGAGDGEFSNELRQEIIDLIINLSNCDRQNNAEVYTKFIMFLIEDLGAPVLDYFDEWSDWLNAWDVKNLDFCNLPDLNIPKFKLFPLNIRLPDISLLDIFGFILGAILAILFALLLRLIRAIIQALLSLIPDFIFDFEPCEFANALRDFARVFAGAICAGMNGVDLVSVAACSVLTPQTNNEKNNRDLLNFFKDACGKGILPGPNLARLLDGDADEETRKRAEAYFGVVNPGLATELKLNPAILSDAGSAIGSIVNIGGLLDSLDDFSPTLPGLSANGFVDNLDLCSDPSVADLIDQLCTEPNPALREELERILRAQREAEKDDAANIFKFLTDPNSLASEIENALPNQAHPSTFIPQMVKDGLVNEVPVIKNVPRFALGRDQETLKELHEDAIKFRLESLDSCLTTYGNSLVRRTKRYEDKLEKLNSPLRPFARPINESIPLPDLNSENLTEIRDRAFANILFYPDDMPIAAKELFNTIIDENPEIMSTSEKINYDIGVNFYNREICSPIAAAQQQALEVEEGVDTVLTADIPLLGGRQQLLNEEDISGPLGIEKIENGLLVEQVINNVDFNEEISFNVLAKQLKKMGKSITKASYENKLKNAEIDLDEEEIDDLLTEDEEAPLESTAPSVLPGNNVSELLPTSQQENIIDDYLNKTFRQEQTYKRFIKNLPEYSELLLAKTDDEIVNIQENIKTIFKCIILEDAHLRFAVLDPALNANGGNIIAINNLSTSTYNRSSLSEKIKNQINNYFSAFEISFNNGYIYGWNAISYYAYEISKITGRFASLSRTLGRRATPQEIMFQLIEEAAQSVNDAFATSESSLGRLLYSSIEGRESNSIIFNFDTPKMLDENLVDNQLEVFLQKSINSSNEDQSFLTSNLSFKVSLKPESDLNTLLEDLTIDDFTVSSETDSFPLGETKANLQSQLLQAIKDGEEVLLGVQDLFTERPESSELYFADKLLELSGRRGEISLGDFVFNNFNVHLKYRVFTTYGTRFLPNPSPAFALNVEIGSRTELASLGLHKEQKISTILAGGPTARERAARTVFGATFILTELCNFEQQLFSYAEIRDRSDIFNGALISTLMLADNTTQLANNFKSSASINILLSCLLPVPNIINETTSYYIEQVTGDIEQNNDNDVRDIIFKPQTKQNKICTKVSKDFLKNV